MKVGDLVYFKDSTVGDEFVPGLHVIFIVVEYFSQKYNTFIVKSLSSDSKHWDVPRCHLSVLSKSS